MNRLTPTPLSPLRRGAGCLALAAGLVGCGSKAAPVVVAAPDERAVVAAAPGWVDADGGVQRLGARSDGVIRHIAVHEGDHVAAGAVLIQLDEDRARLDGEVAGLEIQRQQQELAGLRAQRARLDETIARLRPLVAQQAEPEDELRGLQAQSASLVAQIELAKTAVASALLQRRLGATRLAQLQVRAAAAGEVLRVLARDGDAVTAGTPLLWLAPDGPLQVRAELDERLFARVQPGMAAEVRAESGEGAVFAARVLRVARVVGPVRDLPGVRPAAPDDRVVECVLALDGHALLVGQRVLVRIFAAP